MERRHRRRFTLRHGLAALAAVAALSPAVAHADTTPSLNATLDSLFATVPEGATVQAVLAAAGSNSDSCVFTIYLDRLVVAANFGAEVECSGGVYRTTIQATACDHTLGNCAVAAQCDKPGNSCESDGTIAPSLLADDVTVEAVADIYSLTGWTWNPPPGCSSTSYGMQCDITRDFPALVGGMKS